MADRHTLRIFHLSDLHAKEAEVDLWRRRRVLGEAWDRNLAEMAAAGPVDLVCFTGDAAFSGRPGEFAAAGDFLAVTLKELGVSRERLFLVPGNHDVDRTVEPSAWKFLRRHLWEAKPAAIANWIAGGKLPLGFKRGQREKVLARQAAYRAWVTGPLGRSELVSGALHPLGYRQTLHLPGLPFPIHIIGFDSAWMCGDDADAKNLWLTDAQVMRLTSDERGGPLPGFRLALIHHPFDELFDGSTVRRLLADRVDLVLRGHLHEPEPQLWADPLRSLVQLPAGCLYEHDTYPNSCQGIEIALSAEGRPRECGMWFRGWAPRGHWFNDNSLYPNMVNGRLKIDFLAVGADSRLSSTSSSERPILTHRVFVGRDDELAELKRVLLARAEPGAVAICALQGMPGVGKTYLAERFAAENAAALPGGLVRLVLDPANPEGLTASSLLGELADRLEVPAAAGLAERLSVALRSPRALLLIENVDSPTAAHAVAPLAHELAGCPLLVTGRYRELGRTRGSGWQCLDISSLKEELALEQLSRELGEARHPPAPAAQRLVRELGYLPLAIHLAAGYLRYRSVDSFLELLKHKRLALGPLDPADPVLQGQEGRATLAATFEVSLKLLRAELSGHRATLLFAGFQALGFAPAGGVGTSLGAAIAGLSHTDFEELAAQAEPLSLLDRVTERTDPAWKLHPLLAELLRHVAGDQPRSVLARMTDWFLERLPWDSVGETEEQHQRRKELQTETEALVVWLGQVPAADRPRVVQAGETYADLNGPYSAWAGFCEAALAGGLAPEDRSYVLLTLAKVTRNAGLPERALEAAKAKRTLDIERGANWEAAQAAGVIAGILEDCGQLDEAMRIHQEEELPVYEKLGDTREWALTMGSIADILQQKGQLDEALRIRQEEQLPVFERLGDARERAVAMGRIANILKSRGQLDEALRIHQEELLPACEMLGDLVGRAVNMGQIASILQSRGQHDDALRLRQEEELPVYEGLNLRLNLLRGRRNLAMNLLARNQEGDREVARSFLLLAFKSACEMNFPEADQIEEILKRHDLTTE